METGMIMDGVMQTPMESGSNTTETLATTLNSSPSHISQFIPRKPKQQVREYKKIGRNDECPCGSGKKYKNCCLKSGKYEGLQDAV